MSNENTELATVQTQINPFSTKESFEHIQRVATMFSKSDMIPKRYINNIGNCIIAIEMATRMNANILMVMQNLDVIQGKPGWSSVFLIATLNASGKFSPLRYEDSDLNGGSCRAWAIDKANNEKVFGAWVSMDMAKAEGWIEKNGSKWKTMPELMRRYRAASFFTKQFAPEVSMGLQTIEEIIDITKHQDPAPTGNKEDKELERLKLMISDCKTLSELQDLQEQITKQTPEFDVTLFDERKQQLLEK